MENENSVIILHQFLWECKKLIIYNLINMKIENVELIMDDRIPNFSRSILINGK